MVFVRFLALLAAVLLSSLSPLPAPAETTYGPGCPCGCDPYGNPYPCTNVSPNMLEATCQTTADPGYCLAYYRRACGTGFALACRLAEIGSHCEGGDRQMCQYFISLLQASRACSLEGNRRACDWMARQRL